jgi:hypothetical protein
MQIILSKDQLEAFHHDGFVEHQVRHFRFLVGDIKPSDGVIADVGGRYRLFAKRLMRVSGFKVRVMDTDLTAMEACHSTGVDAVLSDATDPQVQGDEAIVIFNHILHHPVGRSGALPRRLQRDAPLAWRGKVRGIFINEYCYESYIGNASGWLIYQITRSRFLSSIARWIARFAPCLKSKLRWRWSTLSKPPRVANILQACGL